MMRRVSIGLAVTMALTNQLAAAPGLAQSPKQINQHNQWVSFSHNGEGGTTCFVLAKPKEMLPQDRDHGDVYFMLTQHPGQGSNLEPQFLVGYAFKDESRVTLDIDGKKFAMFTSGQNAWMENAAEEPLVVDAMRAGSNMSLTGESRRGTQTKYNYSLSGVTASLADISNCR